MIVWYVGDREHNGPGAQHSFGVQQDAHDRRHPIRRWSTLSGTLRSSFAAVTVEDDTGAPTESGTQLTAAETRGAELLKHRQRPHHQPRNDIAPREADTVMPAPTGTATQNGRPNLTSTTLAP